MKINESFFPFIDEQEKTDYRIVFRQCYNKLELPLSEILYQDQCYCVYENDKGNYIRSFIDPPKGPEPYAVAAYDDARHLVQVDYLAEGARCVSEMQNCFFHIDFESLLIRRDRVCFHAACVQTEYGGILFSGPSGIGKSTQAELWCRLRGARQINGDRPILSKAESGWLAWGSPYAGSSKCYVNESCPITAVVMLEKAAECRLRRMRLSEAFRAVWSGLTVHGWDRNFMEKASDLAMDLIGSVPVYALGCTPDERAVETLENMLKGERCI